LKQVPCQLSNPQSEIHNPQFRKTSFFKRVYRIVRQIPAGKVLTYGQIATLLGAPYMARQVGWAMHGCPPGLPWQRVVGAGGKILINSLSTGEGPLLQRKLLEMEGVSFAGKKVDMKVHQFILSKGSMGKNRNEKRGRPAAP
jgi:methylated-DNA-protein-cysteine methyltransferase-like protein